MLIVSDRALSVMVHALDAGQLPEEQVLRLAKTGEGEFGLVLGEAQAGDEIISQDDKPVLYMDGDVSTALTGATLDVAGGTTPGRFALRMPEPGY